MLIHDGLRALIEREARGAGCARGRRAGPGASAAAATCRPAVQARAIDVILVDTSVSVDHLRRAEPSLAEALAAGLVLRTRSSSASWRAASCPAAPRCSTCCTSFRSPRSPRPRRHSASSTGTRSRVVASATSTSTCSRRRGSPAAPCCGRRPPARRHCERPRRRSRPDHYLTAAASPSPTPSRPPRSHRPDRDARPRSSCRTRSPDPRRVRAPRAAARDRVLARRRRDARHPGRRELRRRARGRGRRRPGGVSPAAARQVAAPPGGAQARRRPRRWASRCLRARAGSPAAASPCSLPSAATWPRRRRLGRRRGVGRVPLAGQLKQA